MPSLAKKVTIDLREGAEPITIDGEPFPHYVSADEPLDVRLFDKSANGFPTVRLTLLAEAIEVIPADDETEK